VKQGGSPHEIGNKDVLTMTEFKRELKLIEQAELLYLRLFAVVHDVRSFAILRHAQERYERRVACTAAATMKHPGMKHSGRVMC
jgi:hypothetical protein